MPLTLVLGPANSAKAGEVLGAYGAAARRGALLVVPTVADADHYGREVAGRGDVLGSVLTFSGLAQEIARRAGFTGRRLSAFQREQVLRRVVTGARFTVLADSARSAGFPTAAGNLISELQRALVTPARFTGALKAWATQDERRRGYAAELASLYRGYTEALERMDRLDADMYMRAALDALRAAPGRWGSDPVFFYGFDELTALERDAVETLARVAGAEVTVSLNYEAGRRAFAARAEAVQELVALAGKVRELPGLDEHYAPASREALHHLERSLFEPAPQRIDPGGAIRLFEAGGERAEAELVAAEARRLIGAGTPAEEIAVVCRSPQAAGPLLARVFAQYGLELAAARRLPLAHTPLGRGLLALARCAWTESAPAAELLAYMRTPGVAARPELVDRLELELLCAAVPGADEARRRLGWELREIEALRTADAPHDELAWQARRLFAAPNRGLAPELSAAEEPDAAALRTFLAALDDLTELGETPSGTELIALLEELEVQRPARPGPGAVLLSDPLGIRARRFRAVFVCGLQEGSFPLPGAPEPFLSDERRWELAGASGLRLAAGEQSLERERYLFYACTSRATERLYLSYRSSDEEGNLELPSPFVSDVAELLVPEWIERRSRRLLSDVVWEPDLAPTPRERSRAGAAMLAPRTGEARSRPRVLNEVALRHVRHREVVSAGALESYADCPVKWLVERELAPARMEPTPEPLARGSYVHGLLEELLRRLGGPITPQSLPDALALLETLLAETPSPLAAGKPEPLRAAARRSVQADIRRYLQREAGDGSEWEPQGIELRFGFTDEDEPSLPALALAEDVAMRGVIDRVDVDPAGGRAIVRDYKTGGVRGGWAGARWEEDHTLQVALYMVAVRELLGLTPVAGFYQPLSGDLRPRGAYLDGAPLPAGAFTNDERSPEDLDETLSGAVRAAVEIAGQLRTGELVPCPQTCSRFGCRYPGICRSQ